MTKSRVRPFTIRDARHIRLLASPTRQAILDVIEARGPMTVAELATHLRRPADRLYYHVRLLERAKLLAMRDAVNGAGRTEATFDVPGRPMRLQYRPSIPANRLAVSRVLRGVLQSARRDLARALSDKTVRADGPRRELWAGRVEAVLTAQDIATVNEKLSALLDEIVARRRNAKAGGKYYQLTWALSPARHP